MKKFEVTIQAHRTMIVTIDDLDVGPGTNHKEVAMDLALEEAFSNFPSDCIEDDEGWDAHTLGCHEIEEEKNQ